ncbi:hypothetical protein BHM03_00035302 [Ensete ventricosum]|nr:hypothetical protein BHM03_00035302 [Ensete ventricosum]
MAGTTLVEQFLHGLVGLHVGLLQHGVDIGVGVVPDDFPDGLDGLPDPKQDHLTSAVDIGDQHHTGRDRLRSEAAKPLIQRLNPSPVRGTRRSVEGGGG